MIHRHRPETPGALTDRRRRTPYDDCGPSSTDSVRFQLEYFATTNARGVTHA